MLPHFLPYNGTPVARPVRKATGLPQTAGLPRRGLPACIPGETLGSPMVPMKQLAIPTLALLALAACSDNPSPLSTPAGELASRHLVITEGVAAPVYPSPRIPLRSDLSVPAALNGSISTPLALNGENCTAFPTQSLQVTYSISGRQDHPASFQVNTRWVYDGSTFAGSVPATVSVPPRTATAPATIRSVTFTVENASGGGAGAASFPAAPFNVSTSSPAALGVTNGGVTIQVAFDTCAQANTPPTLLVPQSFSAVEATSSAGAVVSYAGLVTATDDQDGELSPECTPASGSTFPLGETTVECSVTDSGGLSASASFVVKVVDTTAPVFSGVPTATTALIAANLQGAVLDIGALGISAADVGDVSGPATIQCLPADGSTLPIGTDVQVSCTATDNSQYSSPNTSAPVTFRVTVGLTVNPQGFLSPLRMAAPYSAHKLGSTVPHKFLPPLYADGTPATDLAGGLRLVLNRQGSGESYEQATESDFSAGSTAWRYDPTSGHYVFNLQTQKGWGGGEWSTAVSFAGVTLASTSLSLRK